MKIGEYKFVVSEKVIIQRHRHQKRKTEFVKKDLLITISVRSDIHQTRDLIIVHIFILGNVILRIDDKPQTVNIEFQLVENVLLHHLHVNDQ